MWMEAGTLCEQVKTGLSGSMNVKVTSSQRESLTSFSRKEPLWTK